MMKTLLTRLLKRSIHSSTKMANSKYDYVRQFESDDRLLPNAWIVVRVDGKAFHAFADAHAFQKPNCKPALDLMSACARKVLEGFNEITLAYGQSDEYSFVFRPDARLYSRRSFKLATNIASLFAANYVMQWRDFFPDTNLRYPPAFDARTVLYPTEKNLRDYLSWRQVDCHINNLYNTAFWALVLKGGLSNREAEQRLKGTVSGDKNEILFSEFGVNYNNEPEQYRKGTVLWKCPVEIPIEEVNPVSGKTFKVRNKVLEANRDIIQDVFWTENQHLLEPFRGR